MSTPGVGPSIPARIVVMGASAGALDALSRILPALPAGYPYPVLIVVHVPPDRASLLAPLLTAKCALPAREAEDKEPIVPGTIFVAPPDYHMLVETPLSLALSVDDPVNFSRPSVDVLFESAAEVFGPAVIGVVLTGASSDGARGLGAIGRAGGATVVLRPDLAFSPTMPDAAREACPGALVLSLEEIADFLKEVAELE